MIPIPKEMHKWEDNPKMDLALKCQYIRQILKAHLCTTCIWMDGWMDGWMGGWMDG